jgi:hypothetical protein
MTKRSLTNRAVPRSSRLYGSYSAQTYGKLGSGSHAIQNIHGAVMPLHLVGVGADLASLLANDDTSELNRRARRIHQSFRPKMTPPQKETHT